MTGPFDVINKWQKWKFDDKWKTFFINMWLLKNNLSTKNINYINGNFTEENLKSKVNTIM